MPIHFCFFNNLIVNKPHTLIVTFTEWAICTTQVGPALAKHQQPGLLRRDEATSSVHKGRKKKWSTADYVKMPLQIYFFSGKLEKIHESEKPRKKPQKMHLKTVRYICYWKSWICSTQCLCQTNNCLESLGTFGPRQDVWGFRSRNSTPSWLLTHCSSF